MMSTHCFRTNAMDTPRPLDPSPRHSTAADEARMVAWLKLRDETAELHAKLVYLKLLLTLGVRRG